MQDESEPGQARPEGESESPELQSDEQQELPRAITRGRVVAILKKIPVFEGLTDDEYGVFIDVCHVNQYAEGDEIFREGDSGYDVYVLLAGSVDITTDKAGTIHSLAPGEIVGEIALVSHVKRTATAIAVEDASLLRLTRGELDMLLGKAPRVSYVIMRNIAQTLAQRLMGVDDRLGVDT